MTEETITALGQREEVLESSPLRTRIRTWFKERNFYFFTTAYILLCIGVYILTLKEMPLHGRKLKPGLILGLFFPSLSILYFYRYYWKKATRQVHNIMTWILPALLIHVIIIFGFMISLRAPDKLGYVSSMYSSFYTYGNVFKSFHKLEEDFLDNIGNYVKESKFSEEELSRLYHYYASYFRIDEASEKKPEILARIVYLQKFMKLSPRINRIPFYIAFAFGFLGALIFSLGDAVSRFNTLDLYPKTYLFYSIRFVVSASLAVTLAYLVIKDWPILMGPLVFFLIGYFPERAIKYLDDKMTKFLGIKEKKYKPIPLSEVQGLSAEKAIRLREVGIQDVQNLALADIYYLERNTPFTAAMLADWMAQSLLILYFPENIDSLRHNGVRTILDFKECMLTVADEHRDGCAALIGVETVHLLHIDQILRHDYMQKRLKQLQTELGKYSKTEFAFPEMEQAIA